MDAGSRHDTNADHCRGNTEGARSCDMADELGTLETGILADVLVVDGNPLADVHALFKVRLVLREGKSI